MKLRTRLIFAFLLLSVLPLTAVTGYSYYSSRRAFERAVEAETQALTAEMSRRMELVTADLEQRVDRLWDAPVRMARADAVRRGARPGEVPEGTAPRASGRIAETPAASAETAAGPDSVAAFLGQAANFLERIEFTPAAAAAPAPTSGTAETPTVGPAPPPAPPVRPAPPAGHVSHGGTLPPPPSAIPVPPPAPIVIDLKQILAKAAQDDPDARKALEEAKRLIDELQIKAGPAAKMGVDAAAVGLRLGAAELSRLAQERTRVAVEKKRMMRLEGGWVDLPIHRDGAVVATASAQLNVKQVLTAVMSMSRRDQGEIAFAIDADSKIFTPRPGDLAKLQTLELSGKSGRVQADQPWLVAKKQDASGVTFGIARPIGDSLRDMRRASVRTLGLGLVFIFVALVGIVPMSSHMTRDLSSLTDGVRAIARGDLKARVPVRSRDEFGELATAFNLMANDLNEHQRLVVEQERLHRELELCRQIQNEMLPREPLHLGLTEVKGVSLPAREVGGDFFNYFLLPEGQIALLVGDVSGKGVSAALLMANIQATLRARLPLERDLPALIDAIDRDVEANTPRGVFLTLFVGILDPVTRTMRYVNAGHNPQYLLRGSGELERMGGTGLPVGLFAGHGFKEHTITMAIGDLLFFYTDGMVEVENEGDDLFGAERLEELLARAHDEGLDHLLARVEAAVRTFRGAAEPFDDATMMALRLG